MTIEEKAKAYDEALKVLHKYDGANIMFTQDLKEEMFPELKESEDETIKNEIINFIKDNTLTYTNRGSEMQMKWIAWLEKQRKETSWKPSKEEMDVLYALAYVTYEYDKHKEEVITHLYQDLKREFFNGSSYENMFPNTEDGVRRRSTIQVLEYARSLDAYNQYGKADIDKNIAWLEKRGEQQLPIEKLPSEMKTVGESLGFTTQEDCDRYNQMVTDLIMSDDDKGEQNPAWSEEDEKNLFDVTMELEYRSGLFQLQPKDYSQMIEWLKSLRYRYAWKPSDEQIDILWDALCTLKHDNYKHSDIVNSLYQALKKLKEK